MFLSGSSLRNTRAHYHCEELSYHLHSATAIDHIWHNRLDSTLKCGILMSDTSDHFSPFVISSGSIDDAEVEDSFFVYRCWKNMESEEFYDYVSGSINEYTHNSNLDNIDVSVDRLVCILQNALDKFCPMIKVKCSRDKDKQKPWLTDEIRSLIKEKNRLHNKYLKRPLTFGHQYKNIRNRLNNLKKYTKKNYFCNLLINSQSNCKKTWEVINLILNRQNSKQGCTKIIQNNTILTDKNEIAESMASLAAFSSLNEVEVFCLIKVYACLYSGGLIRCRPKHTLIFLHRLNH